MSDLVENHILGFPTRRLNSIAGKGGSKIRELQDNSGANIKVGHQVIGTAHLRRTYWDGFWPVTGNFGRESFWP